MSLFTNSGRSYSRLGLVVALVIVIGTAVVSGAIWGALNASRSPHHFPRYELGEWIIYSVLAFWGGWWSRHVRSLKE